MSDYHVDPYEQGMRVRREVLGDAHVDRAVERTDELTRPFQDLITRYAWGKSGAATYSTDVVGA
jgi:alkylhydroperoxidase/carboxymuconolactone decarboxylase family protein YurZ